MDYITKSSGFQPDTEGYYIVKALRNECFISTCPLKYSYRNYAGSVPANVFFIVFFALLLIGQTLLSIQYRTWNFSVAMCIGTGFEVAGYVGRFLLHDSPWNDDYFSMYALIRSSPDGKKPLKVQETDPRSQILDLSSNGPFLPHPRHADRLTRTRHNLRPAPLTLVQPQGLRQASRFRFRMLRHHCNQPNRGRRSPYPGGFTRLSVYTGRWYKAHGRWSVLSDHSSLGSCLPRRGHCKKSEEAHRSMADRSCRRESFENINHVLRRCV